MERSRIISVARSGFELLLPQSERTRREVKRYVPVAEKALKGAWESFGGPTGSHVNFEQIEEIVNFELFLDIAYLCEEQTSTRHGLLRSLYGQEITDLDNARFDADNITDEMRLKASMLLADIRHDVADYDLPGVEKQRRATACTSAIDLLMNS